MSRRCHERVAVIHHVAGINGRIAEIEPDVIVIDLENPIAGCLLEKISSTSSTSHA